MQTFGLIVLGLFVLLGAVFFGIFINARRKAAAGAHWPTVPGKVLSNGMQDPATRMLHDALNVRTCL
jgi:hypothetical protein